MPADLVHGHVRAFEAPLGFFDASGYGAPSIAGFESLPLRNCFVNVLATSNTTSGSLDLASVIKATQAISSEVKAERLFGRLMSAIIENAGAQRGCLILRSEPSGELRVEAMAHVEADAADVAVSMPFLECEELCPEIVRYVARTLDHVVIDHAVQHPAYGRDS